MAQQAQKALAIGDVVRLNGTTGPALTVINIPSPQTVQVAWFNEELSLRLAEVTINAVTLLKVRK
jgi:hypothetical protein